MYQEEKERKKLINNIRVELQDEYDKNLDTIKVCQERSKLSHFNKTEQRLGRILFQSMIPYLGLLLTTSLMTMVIGPETVANIMNPLIIPSILTIESLGIGTIINAIGEKNNNIKNRINSYSKAQTEVQKIEEQIFYEIEIEKTKNRNNAIKWAQQELDYNHSILNNKNNPCENNPNQITKELETKLNELYQELDILSTKKVLSEKFIRTRDIKISKLDKTTIIIGTSHLSYILFG